ncbi:serine hydrolase domain-containing protein [Bacteroidota bacterium]
MTCCLRIIVTLIIIFFNIIPGCFAQENEQAHEIERIINKYFDNGYYTGTILVADKNGILYNGAFGYADRETQRKLTIETPFYIASVSKQFVSSAALILVSEGKLNLDDPIIKYLDGLPSFCQQITIRNLLNHTSGFPDYYNVIDVTPGFTNEDVLDFVLGLTEPVFPPGTQYAYNSTGYVLMSSIIQKICEQDFSAFMNERVFNPVGMKNSYVLDDVSAGFSGKAIGYAKSGEIVDYKFRTTGGGGIYSTVYDLYLWDRALYTGKQVSKYLLKSQAFNPSTLLNGKPLFYGLGWNINPEDHNIVYHGGSLVGFRTLFYRDTKKRHVIIIFSNNGCEQLTAIQDEINELLNNNK